MKESHVHCNCYYQGENRGGDYLHYTTHYEETDQIEEIMMLDMLRGTGVIVPSEYIRLENSILAIRDTFMQNLTPSYYRITIRYTCRDSQRITHISYLQVCSSEKEFVEDPVIVGNDTLDYYYDSSRPFDTPMEDEKWYGYQYLKLLRYRVGEPGIWNFNLSRWLADLEVVYQLTKGM